MRDNAAAARALRADEYEARFLRPVEPSWEEQPRRREPRPRVYGNRPEASPRSPYLSDGVPGRRTIQITGQAAPPRRRSTTSAAFVARPDRTAMWAFPRARGGRAGPPRVAAFLPRALPVLVARRHTTRRRLGASPAGVLGRSRAE